MKRVVTALLYFIVLPPPLQVVLVSATLPHEVLEMTHKFMTDPVRILVKRDELTLEVSSLGGAGWAAFFLHWVALAGWAAAGGVHWVGG